MSGAGFHQKAPSVSSTVLRKNLRVFWLQLGPILSRNILRKLFSTVRLVTPTFMRTCCNEVVVYCHDVAVIVPEPHRNCQCVFRHARSQCIALLNFHQYPSGRMAGKTYTNSSIYLCVIERKETSQTPTTQSRTSSSSTCSEVVANKSLPTVSGVVLCVTSSLSPIGGCVATSFQVHTAHCVCGYVQDTHQSQPLWFMSLLVFSPGSSIVVCLVPDERTIESAVHNPTVSHGLECMSSSASRTAHHTI